MAKLVSISSLKVYLDSVDPNLSAQLIAPMEEATTKEVVETTLDFSKISSGMVVNAPPSANAQLRLQVIQQILTGTNEIPATDLQEKLQSDENLEPDSKHTPNNSSSRWFKIRTSSWDS